MNMACNAPDYNPDVLSTLTRTAEAFARVTYQGIYLIGYYRQELLYVSDNPLFLCGHTAEKVRGLGYRFYLKHVPETDQKMLVELNRSSFKLFGAFDAAAKCQCYIYHHIFI